MSLTSLLNPYTYIGVAVVIASVGGTMFYQNHEIHSWHVKYDTEHTAKIADEQTIANMLSVQKDQTTKTGQNVTSVITVPGPVQTMVKTIHDAPEPQDCSTPVLSEDIKNDF